MRYLGLLLFTLVGCGSTEEKTVVVPGDCTDATTPGDTSAEAAVDTGVDSTPGDTGVVPDAETGTTCPIKTGGDLCAKVAKYTFPDPQVVDGVGAEFCDVPATTFVLKDGVVPTGVTKSLLPTKVQARLAWSSQGVHAHFHVDDAEVVALPLQFYSADEVQLFLGGSTPLYGEFSPTSKDKGFMSIRMTPPSPVPLGIPGSTEAPAAMASVSYLYKKPSASFCTNAAVPLLAPAKFAGRVVPGGYELELFVPWTLLGRATAPTSGDQIAANLGVGANDDPASRTPPFDVTDPVKAGFAFWKNLPVSGAASPCCGGEAFTSCDTRTWCTPTLE
ncbi:MAG: hypothetical protein IPJ34_05555 [Myxococcales bacterium]|nr:hypothetical protein [Myxococcales bacterium]